MVHEATVALIETEDDAAIIEEAKDVQKSLDHPIPIATEKANLIHSATAALIEGLENGDQDQVDAAKRFLNEALDL